jgi:predicted transcriptional regulator
MVIFLSEFRELLLEKFSKEEAERKIGMIDKSKNILRTLITSGYWDIINYMMKKVGKPESPEVYVLELHKALGMETGDIWHKLKMLEKLRIVKNVGTRPATPKYYRGGRPRKIYVINTDFWEVN